jgi:hypothetical protein
MTTNLNRNPMPGENVNFVLSNGEARPAIIITNTGQRCSLHVFALGDDTDRKYFDNPVVKNVEYNEAKTPGTYHWLGEKGGEQSKTATQGSQR